MQNYAKIGGILSIVSGGFGAFGALFLILFSVLLGVLSTDYKYQDYYGPENFIIVIMVIYIVCGIVGLAISALAIVGGVNALKRKNWGLALAGAIGSVMAFFPCGVVAIVFIALGKAEFETPPAPRTA